ncbi:hypothetical protein MAR_030511 [Mya arenaria]|uniref:Uncharacterized protein n=1 Tax=Mya arenaria TaxID=6604 RepID=A0ABY7F2R7_MYAAR|nr:hypothetical protein MAR_030511 [Mya arenaria]
MTPTGDVDVDGRNDVGSINFGHQTVHRSLHISGIQCDSNCTDCVTSESSGACLNQVRNTDSETRSELTIEGEDNRVYYNDERAYYKNVGGNVHKT